MNSKMKKLEDMLKGRDESQTRKSMQTQLKKVLGASYDQQDVVDSDYYNQYSNSMSIFGNLS